MNGYQAFCIYNSIKLHFSRENYDAFKYNFRTSIKQSSFEKRRDRYFFEKIARRYPNDSDLKLFMVDNIIAENVWIGDMEDSIHSRRDSHRQALFYNFEKEVKLISEIAYKYKLSFDGVCRANSTKTDNLLLNLYISQQISLDTVVIIDHFVSFVKSLKQQLSDPLGLTQSTLLTLSKYKDFILPLIETNENKYRKTLITAFTNTPNQYRIELVANTPQY